VETASDCDELYMRSYYKSGL